MGGTRPHSFHRALRPPHSAQEAASGVGAQPGTAASSTAGCGAAGPGPSAWAAEYIFYLSEIVYFSGFLPDYAFSPRSCPGGPRSLYHARVATTGSQLGAWVGLGPCCSSLSHQPVPVVRKPGLLSSFLLGECQTQGPSTGLGWE
uniref:Uncharacterized protein n=1 Tax=Mandrillus leucophaeus TaxID=9568 RepID=A0A2K6AG55_MANLE